MTWNHRILKHTEKCGTVWYAIHEVYYSKKGKPKMCTTNPITIIGDNKKEIKWVLKHMIKDCKKPILNFEDF